ncbi:MAG: MCP four helix bundle domain-containing protein, partial [Leptospiraceae bacterium]|nr:MCP four helix bundle domain-containing protein [Leptospiraceae bacterium]
MLKNLKIGARLNLGYLTMIVLTVLLVVYVLFKLNDLNQLINLVSKDRIPKMDRVSIMSDNLNQIARSLRNLLLFQTKKEILEEKELILKTRTKVGEDADYLKTVVKSEKGKQLLGNVLTQREKFISYLDKYMELIIEKEDKEAASKLLFGELRPVQLDLINSLADLYKFQVGLTANSATESEQMVSNSRNILIALTLTFLILAFAISFFTSKSITAPLQEVVNTLNIVENNGDFSVQVKLESKDEVGKVGDALNSLLLIFQNMLKDTETLIRAAIDGKLATRADANRYKGDFRKIVDGVNQTLDAVINPLNVAADYVDNISRGNMPPKITDNYNGDFNVIKENLN